LVYASVDSGLFFSGLFRGSSVIAPLAGKRLPCLVGPPHTLANPWDLKERGHDLIGTSWRSWDRV